MSETRESSERYVPQVVLITGATSGFGRAAARRFASLDCRLILVGRRAERLAELRAELRVPVHALPLDVRDRGAVATALSGLPQAFEEVDVLVNNAGLAAGLETAQEANLDDWCTMIDTNDKALVTVTQAILPGMVERDCGHVINIGSIAGSYPYARGNVYCASKAFVTQFSLALRADLLGTQVRVTSIEPGLAETEFSLVRFKGDSERAHEFYRGTKPLSAEDVAEAIVWASTLPVHVNINRLEVMPTCQAPGGATIHRAAQ
jgi:3-hydroxy acid dehydrogenase/malonic semialdehyde reductase